MSDILLPIVTPSIVPAENIDFQRIKDAIQQAFENGGTLSVEISKLKTDGRVALNVMGQYRCTFRPTEALEIIQSCFREAEIRRLGEIGNEQAIYELCQILENDPDPEIRAAAATAIGTIAAGKTLINADS